MDTRDSFIDYIRESPNYIANFLMPFYFTTASTMLIEMGSTLGVNAADLSIIFTFFILGAVIGQVTSVFYNRKFKKIYIISVSYILISISLIVLFFAEGIVLFFILYFLTGYCTGVILIQAMQYLLTNNIKNKEKLTLIFLFFYPLGSLTAPFLASYIVKNDINWRYSYLILAAATMAALVFFIAVKGRKESIALDTEERIPFRKIFTNKRKNRIFIFGLVLLFLFSITETVMATWSPTFLRIARSFDITSAGFAVTLFWLGILSGRIAVSFIAGRTKINLIILILSSVGFTSLILFVILKTGALILAAAFVAGLGNSAILPLCISATSTVYEKGRGILVSIVFAVNNAAISLTPLITRAISGRNISLSITIGTIALAFGAFVVMLKIIYEKRTVSFKQ